MKNKHERGVETFTLHFEDEEGGCIPPWVIDRLCSTFRKTQSAFSMTTEVLVKMPQWDGDDKNGALDAEERENAFGSSQQHLVEGGHQGCYNGGYWDTEEGDKWESPGANVKDFKCEKGVFFL